jgi:hypothetical protein
VNDQTDRRCVVRVIVDGEGRIEVGRSGDVVGVRVVDADGHTAVVPLCQVAEEIVLADGAKAQVLVSGAPLAQDAAASGGAGNQAAADLARVTEALRECREAGKQWRERALQLQADVEAQAGGRGQLVSLPVGGALVPLVDPAPGWGARTLVLFAGGWIIILASVGTFSPMAVLHSFGGVVAAYGLTLLASVVLQAARPTPWVPVVTKDGQYRVRVTREGEAEVLARRGDREEWVAARRFASLPEGDLREQLAKARADARG